MSVTTPFSQLELNIRTFLVDFIEDELETDFEGIMSIIKKHTIPISEVEEIKEKYLESFLNTLSDIDRKIIGKYKISEENK